MNSHRRKPPHRCGVVCIDLCQGAAAAPKAASSPVAAGNPVLKDEFKKAVEVFEPPNLCLKNSRIKDAFTNLVYMFSIQDLGAAVGQGTQ